MEEIGVEIDSVVESLFEMFAEEPPAYYAISPDRAVFVRWAEVTVAGREALVVRVGLTAEALRCLGAGFVGEGSPLSTDTSLREMVVLEVANVLAGNLPMIFGLEGELSLPEASVGSEQSSELCRYYFWNDAPSLCLELEGSAVNV